MNAYEIPNLRFSLPAGGAVAKGRFVSVNKDSKAIQATADTPVIGVSKNLVTEDEINAGERIVEIADGIVIVEASAAIEAGVKVSSTADGKAVAHSTGDACGVAITSAGAAGEFVAVKL